MSAIILCRGKVADNPLYIMQSGIRLYTEEELCYYIYNNIYILTNDFINDELITFLRDEVGNTALAQRLTIMKSNNELLASMLVTILKSVDYYSLEQIEKISEILNTLDNQNAYERLGLRGDSFLSNECFYKAVDCYKQIIDEYSNAAPAAFLAGVYHNMGVALARVFLYNEASYSFMKAYEIGQHKNSYKCYLAAKCFMDKDGSVINEDVPEEEYIIRRKIEQLMDNAAYQDEIRKLNDTEKYKNAGDVAGYHKVLDDILTNWKQDYYKYTAR